MALQPSCLDWRTFWQNDAYLVPGPYGQQLPKVVKSRAQAFVDLSDKNRYQMPQFAKLTRFAPFIPIATIAPIATGGLTLGLLWLAAVGCNQSPGLDAKAVTAYRTSFTLAEEPDGVQTVGDVRSTLLGEPEEDHNHDGDDHDEDHEGHEDHAHATESMNVVMVGHIGGLANPWAKTVPEFPFAKTQAIFYLADPLAIAENAEHAHEHSHAPGEECAFCAAHAENQADMLAVVQFVDKNGKVLPVDVRQLFEVKEKDIVVVSGKARVTAGGILAVEAKGLYVRE